MQDEAHHKTKAPLPWRRLRSLSLIFLLSATLLTVRLVDIQVVRAPHLAETASKFRTATYTLHAKRGDIVDANGAVLATSVERYNVAVNQKLIGSYVRYGGDNNDEVLGTGAAAAAEVLAPLLEMDRAELGGILLGGEEKSTFVYLKKDISPELWREINALHITGIEPEQVMKRVYPNGTVAGNVIGYMGEVPEEPGVSVGQAGVELTEDSVLSGVDGSLTVELAGGGAVLPNGKRTEVPSVDGSTVQLTIERDLQMALQDSIDSSVATYGAEWGAAVVIEIGTGRVLALADSHSPDPGNIAASAPEDRGSRAVSTPVEPGSTGKLITFAAGLEQGLITPYSVFQVSSQRTMPNGQTISDNDEHETANMTVAGILGKSYNTGLIQIGDLMSDSTRFDYMLKFGIGSKTGIELPGESAGILHDYEQWDGRTRYNTMFGYAWALTAMQLAQMVSIFGNDGMLVQPHIVDTIIGPDGTETPIVPVEPKRVISSETSDTMLQLMQAVTQEGSTGYAARIDGYNVAGKTGTAEVADENGELTKRVGTFAGVIPAENPQIAIGVVLYNPEGKGYGGTVAAPVFHDIATFAVRQLAIPPSTVPLVEFPWYENQLNSSAG